MTADTAGLWLAVVASGLYHGANPGMGWPLAVSAAMLDRRPQQLWRAIGALAAGHFAAMVLVLVPFAVLDVLVLHQREIRIVSACLVAGYGVFLCIRNKHPKILVRIPATRLALWSMLAASAHGAGLMLVPMLLGLHASAGEHAGHLRVGAGLGNAMLVATVHTAVMALAGGAMAYAVYRWLGPSFIRQSWLNLDRAWAVSLVLVGVVSLVLALR
jgi:hypothetical protein